MSKKTKNVEPQYINSRLNNPMLNYKTYKMAKTESVLVRFVAFILGGIVSFIFYGNLFMIDGYASGATYISNAFFFCALGFGAMKFLTPMYIKRCLDKRNEQIKNQFRDMLESLAASFSAGSNVLKAFESAIADLQMQYTEKDFIVIEMKEIIAGVQQNINIDLMLYDFAMRSANEDILSFADVFSVCYQKGGNMNSVIGRTHDVISDKMAIADEIKTKLTSNKMQHNVMSIMPIAVVAMLKFTNESFSENFATPLGVIVNTIAIGIFVGAYIYGNKIVDIKE